MEDINSKKYGVKVSILSTMDFDDFKEIGEVIKEKGYKVIIADNGNMICVKE